MKSIKKTSNVTRRRQWFLILLLSVMTIVLVGVQNGRVTATDAEPLPSIPPASHAPTPEPKLAEQVYKNIQIFKRMPAADLEPSMAFIAGSLGVKCNHCHVNPFEKDDKPTKQTARQMIRMVLELNKGTFNGEKAVTCFTCHRGKPKPLSVPAVGQNLWQPTPNPAKESPLPTVEQVLEKYVQGLGGAAALQKVTSRVTKGSRIGADGVLVPEEVYQKAPNKIVTITAYPGAVFSTGFNGLTGWGSSSREGKRELPAALLAQVKSDAQFYKETKLKELYSKLAVSGKTTIGDAEVYVIDATPLTGNVEKLFFDASTGLLLRRYTESETFLGMFPLQTDYGDYREVDGVKQPFLIHWSMPGRVWGRTIMEVKQNVVIDDAKFDPPKP